MTESSFSGAQVAKAIGMSAANFHMQFARGHWRKIGAERERNGLPNLFSLRDAMCFAVAARLIEATNAKANEAFDIAARFAFTGDTQRDPGALYSPHERGETVLIYWPDRRAGRVATGDEITSLWALMNRGTPEQEAATVINLNPIEARVFAALGVSGHSWDGIKDDGSALDTGELVPDASPTEGAR